MSETFPVAFSVDELWILQAFVRHEQGTPWQGKWPAFSLDLNDAIAEALVFCDDNAEQMATLQLSKGDCYLVDYCVPNNVKDANGRLIGKQILMKSFHARQAIAYGDLATAEEPASDDVTQRLNTVRKALE